MGDAVNYLLFTNPVSQSAWSVLNSAAKVAGLKPKGNSKAVVSTVKEEMANLPLWKLAGSNIYWLKLAGLSGATAVILGAWGAHRAFPIDQEGKRDLKAVFETANKYHFYHTIALLAVPLCKRPAISGSLFLIGTALFSGACYYNAFTGDKSLNRLAPVGGMTLILAWLTLVL